jgi:hypothetical protein
MFKPLTRSKPKTPRHPTAGFAETQFLHRAEDDDYSGFAPTEMFEDVGAAPAAPVRAATTASRAAASTSHSALERAASGPAAAAAHAEASTDEPLIPPSWVTSQWVAVQEAKAHEAAHRAREVIAAQRHAEAQAEAAAPLEGAGAPRTGLGRLRAAFERLLPGEFRSLLPLFIGVTVTMALISAVLPMFDKP